MRNRRWRFAAALPLLLAGCAAAAEAPRPLPDVCPSGCRHASIQGAIDAAPPGGTIVVGAGTYRERVDFRGKPLTLRSVDPRDARVVAATVIDAGGSGSAVTFRANEGSGSVLAGFTITGGTGTPRLGQVVGGGILVVGAAPVIAACVVRGNRAEMGAGIAVYSARSPAIRDCTIEGNEARGDGGGVYAAQAELSGCRIRDNVARYSGGGVFALRATTLDRAEVTGNRAEANGGGLFFEGPHPGMAVADSLVSGNTAGNAGGGVALKKASPVIRGTRIAGNAAARGGGLALLWGEAQPVLADTVLAGNRARTPGTEETVRLY